jgi:hypothetical protein
MDQFEVAWFGERQSGHIYPVGTFVTRVF